MWKYCQLFLPERTGRGAGGFGGKGVVRATVQALLLFETLTIFLVMKGGFLQIWALFKKDLLLEIRQQYTLYGVLLYVVSTIFVLYLAMGEPEGVVWKGLFWMIQLFVCVNAVAKSFLQEGRGRLLYFYSITGAANFILSKLLFSALLMLLMSLLSLGLFVLMLGDPMPETVR